MFNSKAFFVIIVLTALALGAAVYLQVQEMVEYDLLTKLKKQYLGDDAVESSENTAVEPEEEGNANAKDTTTAKKDASANAKDTTTAKEDDKE